MRALDHSDQCSSTPDSPAPPAAHPDRHLPRPAHAALHHPGRRHRLLQRPSPPHHWPRRAEIHQRPSTAIYNKSELPYGLEPIAAQRLRAGAALAIVEGPLDVEAIKATAASAGLEIVSVAAAGTALTAGHLRSINAVTPLERHQVIIGFDADPAGQAAAYKATQLLAQAGVANPQLVTFEPGSDPAATLQTGGPDELAGILTNRRPALDLVVDRVLRPYLNDAAAARDEWGRRHFQSAAVTPAITAALLDQDGQPRWDQNSMRQLQRIADAVDKPIGDILRYSMTIMFGEDYYDTLDAHADPEPNQAGVEHSPAAHEQQLQPACPDSDLLIDSGPGDGVSQPHHELGIDPPIYGPELGL